MKAFHLKKSTQNPVAIVEIYNSFHGQCQSVLNVSFLACCCSFLKMPGYIWLISVWDLCNSILNVRLLVQCIVVTTNATIFVKSYTYAHRHTCTMGSVCIEFKAFKNQPPVSILSTAHFRLLHFLVNRPPSDLCVVHFFIVFDKIAKLFYAMEYILPFTGI